MSVVNIKGTIVTNGDAVPPALTDAQQYRGGVNEMVDTAEIAAADDDGSTYRLGRVHSSMRISEATAFHDAITGGTSYHFGLYDTAENGGAVVNAALFASAVNLSSASPAGGTLLSYQSASWDVANIAKQIWQLLGLSKDPNKSYDVVATANVVGTAAGTLSLRLRFVSAA